MAKKHVKPKKQGEKGQVVSIARPLNISKIMLLCPNCQKPSRVGYQADRKRYCKKCKSLI